MADHTRPLSARAVRLTFVTGSLGGGGAERNLVRIAAGFAQRGYASTVLTLYTTVPDFYTVPDGVVRVRAPSAAAVDCRWFDVRCQRARRRVLRDALVCTRPDVVVSFIDTINVSVLQALRGTAIPVVVSERTDPRHHPIGWRWRAVRWWMYPQARHVVMLAEGTLPWARRFRPRWRVSHIPNAVPPARLRAPLRHSGRRTVIGMGRLQHEKGFDLLIRAFAAVAAECPQWSLRILGQGPERAALERLATELGVAERVSLEGALADPGPALADADLFVFSSRYEGFGMALAEAMAAGLPVVSFDCPSGPRQIIRHDVDGWLVAAKDVDALAAAMKQLMLSDATRERLAARAPEVCERYSEVRVMDQWETVVRGVLQGGAP